MSSEQEKERADPFISQLSIADNSYVMSGNGVCQACGKSILGKKTCPYCGLETTQ